MNLGFGVVLIDVVGVFCEVGVYLDVDLYVVIWFDFWIDGVWVGEFVVVFVCVDSFGCIGLWFVFFGWGFGEL